MEIDDSTIRNLLELDSQGRICRKEDQMVEYKERFTYGNLADCYKYFASFANSQGGYLIFGVEDSQREMVGMDEKVTRKFNEIDTARISQTLMELFSGEIVWRQKVVEISGMKLGVFCIAPAVTKPVIAKKSVKDIKEGDILYRYSGTTRRIGYAELEATIQERVKRDTEKLAELIKNIASFGVQDVAISDDGIISVKGGAGDKQGIVDGGLGIGKIRTRALTDSYPFSALEFAEEVKLRVEETGGIKGPSCNEVWKAIKECRLKENKEYSAYNFRNKKQEEKYRRTKKLPVSVPSLYNSKAVDFLAKEMRKRVL